MNPYIRLEIQFTYPFYIAIVKHFLFCFNLSTFFYQESSFKERNFYTHVLCVLVDTNMFGL